MSLDFLRPALMRVLLLLFCVTACTRIDSIQVASDENEGGIIGTGIVGTITDLGSIHVNGLRVVYDDDLRVQTAFGKESPKLLRPGDTVSIEAVVDRGFVKATSIERYRPVIAPINAIAEDRSWIEVLGVRIVIDEATSIAMTKSGRELSREDLPVGAWVAVSGLWRDDEVVASRIDWIPVQNLASVRGVLNEAADGTTRIGGVRIKDVKRSSIEVGRIAAAQGLIRRSDGQIDLAVRRLAIKGFSPRIRKVLIEGFVSPVRSSGAYTVYGSGLTSFAEDPSVRMSRDRQLFCGSLNSLFDIRRSLPWPRVDNGDTSGRGKEQGSQLNRIDC